MLKITICANDETLRDEWADIYEDADLQPDQDTDAMLAGIWTAAFVEDMHDTLRGMAVDDYDYEYERSFQFWHGGGADQLQGGGRYRYSGPKDDRLEAALDDCAMEATKAARAKAVEDVRDMILVGDTDEAGFEIED